MECQIKIIFQRYILKWKAFCHWLATPRAQDKLWRKQLRKPIPKSYTHFCMLHPIDLHQKLKRKLRVLGRPERLHYPSAFILCFWSEKGMPNFFEENVRTWILARKKCKTKLAKFCTLNPNQNFVLNVSNKQLGAGIVERGHVPICTYSTLKKTSVPVHFIKSRPFWNEKCFIDSFHKM